ncbi:hypothetical protein ACH5RR_021773 [Cinchona calisaya]|uniref:Beta-glucosidase 12-like n=1 Tax=Cinchona calisaya TaxID=153742 RepID=A0ABD2ZJ80_9GENT
MCISTILQKRELSIYGIFCLQRSGMDRDTVDCMVSGPVPKDAKALSGFLFIIEIDACGVGMDAAQFGKVARGVNEEGIQYYDKLINELLANGLQPYATLFHWDLPQVLEDDYGGFLSTLILSDFHDYAQLCFERFGDRVKHWTTVNEPWSFSIGGYVRGNFAPGRCSSWLNPNCTAGDSATEPYLVTHHQLLAHATAAKLYKDKYQKIQMGSIGITLISSWMVPYSNSTLDHRAARRALDFMLGWCLEPLHSGAYPLTMRALVGKRLPKFTKEQSEMLRGSYDFLGLNYYTAFYASHISKSNGINVSYTTDSLTNLTVERNGIPIGDQGGSDWLHVYPQGIRELLLYVKRYYNNPPIYITENGFDEVNNATIPIKEALVDNRRIKYYHQHLSFVREAIHDGVNVMAYFAWSLMDNFEWSDGYTVRFGIIFVDFSDGLKRYSKHSAKWFRIFLKK